MRLDHLREENRKTAERRPWLADDYDFRPINWHDSELHRLKSQHHYFGFVEVAVEGLGRFVMFSNDDDLVAQTYFWFGPDAYESYSVRIWRHLAEQASCIVDVGAYTGLFSLVAQLTNPEAEVHAVEPIQRCVERLMVNLRVNRLGQRVTVHPVAAGERTEQGRIGMYQGPLRVSSSATLVGRDMEGHEQLPVQIMALDDLESDRAPDLLKIDVEFAEVEAVSGLQRTVEAQAPTLLLEVSGTERLDACRKLLPGYSFALINDDTQTWHLEDGSQLEGGYARNLLWIEGPPERLVGVLSQIPPL